MANSLTTKPAETYTITDFITEGQSDDMTYSNFAILHNSTFGEYAELNVLDFYLDELKKISLRIETFTEDEIAKYKYQPDLLAYDIYGSVQLDFIVLLVNGIIDPKEFDFSRGYILLPTRSNLYAILEKIKNSESKWLNLV
jgi:hypothetical protein